MKVSYFSPIALPQLHTFATPVALSLIHIYFATASSSSLTTLHAVAVETPLGSSIGASSLTSAPTIFNSDTFRIAARSSRKLTPPASGVPVPGNTDGSRPVSYTHLFNHMPVIRMFIAKRHVRKWFSFIRKKMCIRDRLFNSAIFSLHWLKYRSDFSIRLDALDSPFAAVWVASIH